MKLGRNLEKLRNLQSLDAVVFALSDGPIVALNAIKSRYRDQLNEWKKWFGASNGKDSEHWAVCRFFECHSTSSHSERTRISVQGIAFREGVHQIVLFALKYCFDPRTAFNVCFGFGTERIG